MNKEKFLIELREYLSILENQEQEDILEEYAQHIDMKMGKGLSEEEAIRDFGPMEELAAQIMEAYHVKLEFRGRSILPGFPKKGGADAGESFVVRGGKWIGAKCMAAAGAVENTFRWLLRKCRALADWLKKPFTRNKEETGGRMSRVRAERTDNMGGHVGDFLRWWDGASVRPGDGFFTVVSSGSKLCGIWDGCFFLCSVHLWRW